MPLPPERLTCPRVRDKATDRAERKESRARWPAQTLVTGWRLAATETGAATARELQPGDLDRSRWCTAAGRKLSRPMPDQRPLRWRLRTSRIRFTPMKRAV